MKYDVFISYSRANLETVKPIKDEIERTTGIKCWMDLEGIESGVPRFTKSIIDGINQCQIFLFMCSAQSQSSEFALRELNFAGKRCPHIVIVHIDTSQMNEEFEFLYSLTDAIDWNNLPQREKLLRDIKKWICDPDNLPNDITGVSMKHGPEYNRFFSNVFFRSLKERFPHKKSRNNLYIIVAIAAVLSLICLGIIFFNSPNREQQFDATYVKHLADSLSERAYTLTNDTAQYFACLRQSCNYYKEVKDYYAKIDSFPGDYYASYFMFLEFSRSIPNSQIKTYNELASEYEKLISQIENDPNKHVYYETLVKSKYWAGVCYYHLNSPELCLLYLNQVEDYFYKIQNKDPINRYEEIVKIKNDLNK